MAAIQTMTTLIHDGYVEGDGIKKTCERIIERCRQGIVAVTELLTLARVQDSDPIRHKTAIASARFVIMEIAGRRTSQAEQKGITLACQLQDGADLHVHVDQTDLRDCLDNVIENAIKYTTTPGSVAVTANRCHLKRASTDVANEMITNGEADDGGDFVVIAVKTRASDSIPAS